jgi:pSer/pThr/pTyr-binding forkhead associated (FHA) protein
LKLNPLNDTFTTKTLVIPPGGSIKIGRKVNQSMTADPGNAIFDAKVLSRTHAQFVREDDRIWIQDLQSSNGTFLNGLRLSEEGIQSQLRELKDGDKLEFGVDIMEEDGKG